MVLIAVLSKSGKLGKDENNQIGKKNFERSI